MEADLFQVQLLTQFPLNAGKNYTKIQSSEKQIFPFHRYSYILIDYGSLAKPNINCKGKTFIKIPSTPYVKKSILFNCISNSASIGQMEKSNSLEICSN